MGGVGADAITIGSGGVNLAAVARGAASQGFVISTGDGVTDTVTIGSRITTKGAGSVSLTTLGTGLGYGIELAAGVTTPRGSQTFVGAVTLQKDTSLKAGGNIAFSSTIYGASRLTLSAGQVIVLAGDVGGITPLQGITVAAAKGVSVVAALTLDGTGTKPGTSGLVIGKNVNNILFLPATIGNARTISGFSGSRGSC